MSGFSRSTYRPAMLVSLVAAILAAPAIAAAHAVVYPKSSTPGAYEKYVLRVPNEKAPGVEDFG